MRFRALLVDGGGTLFAEGVTVPEYALKTSPASLATLLPELDRSELRRLLEELGRSQQETERAGIQPNDALTAKLLETARPGLAVRASALRHALAKDSWQARQPFTGAAQLLDTAHDLDMATVLVSNTGWLCEEDYWRRMQEMGLAAHLDYLVSSFDVGVRKPNRAPFDRAVERAGCTSGECVMVGDSELNDIGPAADLGMRTIRVTMEHPANRETRADGSAGSLEEVAGYLGRWSSQE